MMEEERADPDGSDWMTDDDLVNIYSDMDVESISDEDDYMNEDTEMFDIFTGQVRTLGQANNYTLDSNVYHQELEREFGEGSRIVTVTNADHLDYYKDFQVEGAESTAAARDPFYNYGSDDESPPDPGPCQDIAAAKRLLNQAFKLYVQKSEQVEPELDQVHSRVEEYLTTSLPIRTSAPINPTAEAHHPSVTGLASQAFRYEVPADPETPLEAAKLQPAFTYTALHDPRRIRLLDILPAQQYSDPLECRIRFVDLPQSSEPPAIAYQALSYAWGEHSSAGVYPSQTIFCGRAKLQITANLHRVLKLVRSHLDSGQLQIYGKRTCIWADAICINQNDSRERNAQVNLMAQTYKRASRVIVWLGDMGDSDETQLKETVANQDAAEGDDVMWQTEKSRDVIEGLLDRPWFRRRWTIQEFAMQSVRTILCGRLIFEYPRFRSLYEAFELESMAGPMKYTRLWNGLRVQRWLLVNLHRFSTAECALPHDLVYSLVSISCGCDRAGSKTACGELNCGSTHFKVDYEKPIRDLILDLGKKFLLKDVGAVLACAAVRQTRPHSPWATRLPSWCPDWRVAPTSGTEGTQYFIRRCFEQWDLSKRAESLVYLLSVEDSLKMFERNQAEYPFIRKVPEDLKLRLIGWVFERSPKGIRDKSYSRQIGPNWEIIEEDGCKTPTPLTTEKPAVGADEKEEVFRGDWPSLEHDQVFCLLPWYRLGLILERQANNECLLVTCFRRPIVLRGGYDKRFSWVSGDHTWVEGSLGEEMLVDVVIA